MICYFGYLFLLSNLYINTVFLPQVCISFTQFCIFFSHKYFYQSKIFCVKRLDYTTDNQNGRPVFGFQNCESPQISRLSSLLEMMNRYFNGKTKNFYQRLHFFFLEILAKNMRVTTAIILILTKDYSRYKALNRSVLEMLIKLKKGIR